LTQAGHLVESDPGMPAVFAAFWSELNVDTRIAASILSSHSIAVSAIGPVDATPLIHALRAFGMRVEAAGSVQIAVVDDYLRPELAELNRQCLARGVPAAAGQAGGPAIVDRAAGAARPDGLLALPRKPAARQPRSRKLRRAQERQVGDPSRSSGARVGIAEHQAYSMLVTQLVRWLVTGRNAELESRVLVADLINFSFSFHQIVKRPQCPDCGDPALGSTAGPARRYPRFPRPGRHPGRTALGTARTDLCPLRAPYFFAQRRGESRYPLDLARRRSDPDLCCGAQFRAEE
jgi:bacteriocin biosynthesis cyclodehydratase domain-containing protein